LDEPDLEVKIVNVSLTHLYLDIAFPNPLSIPLTGAVMQVSGAWVAERELNLGTLPKLANLIVPNVAVKILGWPLTKRIVVSAKVSCKRMQQFIYIYLLMSLLNLRLCHLMNLFMFLFCSDN
jgi:hypothetical protein